MAPLPQNNTDRLWLWYTADGVEHSIPFRFAASAAQADQVAAAAYFANALKSYIRTTDSFFKVTHQDAGSNVSFPLTWTTIIGTGASAPEANDKPHFVSVVGRSLDGRRAKITLYSPTLPDADGYRQDRAPATVADQVMDAVDGMPTPVVSISGGAVIWNQYVNYGYNAYWQKQLRRV